MGTLSNVVQSNTQTSASALAKKRLWVARILSFLPALFLLLDGVMKLLKPAFVVEATLKLGYPERVILGIGVVLVICTLIYLIPRTAVLGAILLTGYLGGAVATHVRAETGWFEVMFPVILCSLLWAGLILRDDRLRTLIPLRNS
jgi:hypothetical protein